jgi:hypothetical protein
MAPFILPRWLLLRLLLRLLALQAHRQFEILNTGF